MRFKDASDRLQILPTLDVTLKSPTFHNPQIHQPGVLTLRISTNAELSAPTGQRKRGEMGITCGVVNHV